MLTLCLAFRVCRRLDGGLMVAFAGGVIALFVGGVIAPGAGGMIADSLTF